MHTLYIKISLLLCVLGFTFCEKPHTTQQNTTSQSSEEGSAMTSFLAKKFPNAQEVYWDTLDNGYSATFYDGKNDYKALFDSIGQFQQTTMLIELEALPATISKYLNEKFKNGDIAIVQLVDDGTHKSYHIEMQVGTDYQTLDFDPSGKLLKENRTPLSNEELKQQEEEGVEDN
jgi:hypothetical protein